MKVMKSKKRTRENIFGILFASTPILGWLIFGLIPMLAAIFMALSKIKGYSFDGAEFLGFDNFIALFKDRRLLPVIKNTLIGSITMPISLVLSLIIASLLNHNKRGTKFFRTVFFVPFVCSVVAVTMMWKLLLDYNFGIINAGLGVFGINPIAWLGDSRYVMVAMIACGVWSGTGFGIILYSASLGNVPKSYYEAAKLDGASGFKQFKAITLPCVSPTTFFLLTIGIIGALQDFSRYQVMLGSDGGVGEAGLTAVFWLWQMGFKNSYIYGMGMASATAIMLAIVIMLITKFNFFMSKFWVHYD